MITKMVDGPFSRPHVNSIHPHLIQPSNFDVVSPIIDSFPSTEATPVFLWIVPRFLIVIVSPCPVVVNIQITFP